MNGKSYNRSVFINCPIDGGYKPLFRATVFAITRCNFYARCAEEETDSSEIRLNKIFRMIEECRFGIHDLSMTKLDKKTHLPRFNMPLELGIFLSAKRFGKADQDKKNCIVFEGRAYSYEKYVSDIKGQDIATHGKKPKLLIRAIRDWLQANTNRPGLPGGSALWREYRMFSRWLPRKCKAVGLKDSELTFRDYSEMILDWIETHSN